MEQLIQVNHIVKKYKKITAVNDISFHISQGEVVGLLGTNGAGKSTTINILSTILKADEGQILYMGDDINKNVRNYKKNIGVIPQEIAIYDHISVLENVKYFAKLYDIPSKDLSARCYEILEAVGLEEKQKELARNLSGGMKRRLNIACGLLHKPRLIIMDEPTVGVDVQSRNFILKFIKQLQKEGASVLYTTHYMEEVEEIADRIIIIKAGKVIADGNLSEIRDIICQENKFTIRLEGNTNGLLKALQTIQGVARCEMIEDGFSFILDKNFPRDTYYKIVEMVYQDGGTMKEISSVKESLETVFLNLTASKGDA